MQFKSLSLRIAVVFLSLILIVQLLGYFFIRYNITNNARLSVSEQLAIGQKVLQNLLDQSSRNLGQGATLLAADYGFRDAIASNDRDTIASALENHKTRIGARIAVFQPLDGPMVASDETYVSELPPVIVTKLIEEAQTTNNTHQLRVINKQPVQFVAVPVKAPATIGWVLMGFAVGKQIVTGTHTLSNIDTTILIKTESGKWTAAASTLDPGRADALAQHPVPAMTADTRHLEIDDNGELIATRYIQLQKRSAADIVIVLQRSIAEAVAPYETLQQTLQMLTLLGVAVFIGGSVLTAQHIAKPIVLLASIAKRLGRGEYHEPIVTDRKDEIGKLSRSLEAMRQAISLREQKITKLAYWDEATEMPNRAAFNERAGQALVLAEAESEPLSVLILDMNRFKQINDVLGQSNADALLKEIAHRFRSESRSERDVIARIDGDSFGWILANTAEADALIAARRLLGALDMPIAVNDQAVDVSAGVGIACFPDHGSSIELLLNRAEMAMYAAKTTNAGVTVYDASLDRSSSIKLSLASELKSAIANHHFKLFVQPKFNLSSGTVESVEALIRWAHPERGMIFPDSFIPFAEETGLISKISIWMLEAAAQQSAQWRLQGIAIPIAVNISTHDLLDQELPAKLAGILANHALLSDAISIEITESSIMRDPARAEKTLEQLSQMGISIAIDDFGTGYSSLGYLKRLPIDVIKIDKSFVLNMDNDIDSRKIVYSTISLGHNLDLEVVAEGVENEGVWNLLHEYGCDLGQGYFVSKPMPSSAFGGWLEQWNANGRGRGGMGGVLPSECHIDPRLLER